MAFMKRYILWLVIVLIGSAALIFVVSRNNRDLSQRQSQAVFSSGTTNVAALPETSLPEHSGAEPTKTRESQAIGAREPASETAITSSPFETAVEHYDSTQVEYRQLLQRVYPTEPQSLAVDEAIKELVRTGMEDLRDLEALKERLGDRIRWVPVRDVPCAPHMVSPEELPRLSGEVLPASAGDEPPVVYYLEYGGKDELRATVFMNTLVARGSNGKYTALMAGPYAVVVDGERVTFSPDITGEFSTPGDTYMLKYIYPQIVGSVDMGTELPAALVTFKPGQTSTVPLKLYVCKYDRAPGTWQGKYLDWEEVQEWSYDRKAQQLHLTYISGGQETVDVVNLVENL